MERSQIRKFDAEKLVVDLKLNFRDEYDLPSMMEEIRQAGGVREPLHVIEETGQILKGNRRGAAVQLMLKDPTLPRELYDAIKKLDCIFYKNLTENEITDLVLDHGSQKPLTRTEIVKAVWRLHMQMKNEREIITKMYHLLARFTGAVKIANEVSLMPAGPAREKRLAKWLHGTVGNYLIAAGQMGPFVREQLLLTELRYERPLTEEEEKRSVIKVDRTVINELTGAKNEDLKTKEGWDTIKGGANFNAILERLKKGEAPTEVTNKAASQKVMIGVADGLSSKLALAYRHCAGTLNDSQKPEIIKLDTELARIEKIQDLVNASLDRVTDASVKEVLKFFLFGEASQLETVIKKHCV